jgi:hypothetical protein
LISVPPTRPSSILIAPPEEARMKQQGIPGVEYIPVQQTQEQVAQRTGYSLPVVRETEQELARKGYGYRLNRRVWMFPKPFAEDATWVPPLPQTPQ